MKRALLMMLALPLVACGPSREERAEGVAAFATVQQVLQHPRCHIPGDAPLQDDEGRPHDQAVVRGPDGHGAPGLPCATCHADANPPDSYGANAPPGAPAWHLPKPEQKMVFIDLSPAELCETIKDEKKTGKNLREMLEHNAKDELVGWGWHPGGDRAPVPIPRAEFVAAFQRWMEAGAPCPEPTVAQK